ncbi:MAG: twin-arginine translocase subunit TatC [Desulfobacca sp.]|uniref:twin-arginine translocase subunit TatC n=1 Tax=Desulfobacca sp. TaxID=2067990 RepID=UPI0040496A1C
MTDLEMPFLDHLQELRKRLIISLIALFIGMGLAWTFAMSALTIIQRPLTQPSLMKRLHYQLVTRLGESFPQLAAKIKVEPPTVDTTSRRLNYMAPLEPFFVQMKLSLIMGFILALPVILYQTWRFIAPGLYPHERKYVHIFVPVGTVAFVVGDLFFLYIVWPLIVAFSLGYESPSLYPLLNLTQYVNFCLRLLLLFGLIFELPLILLILARLGVVQLDFLVRQRRLALLLSLIVAAFHADVITMTMVALPLYGMYEISILVIRLLGRRLIPQTEVAPEEPSSN